MMPWRDLPTPRRNTPRAETPALLLPDGIDAGLCVLASGSSGNCSVLVTRGPAGRPGRVALIDAGLSPSRTRRLLADQGLSLGQVDDIVLTHLDHDHYHHGWNRVRDCKATARMHRRHIGRAERDGRLLSRNEPFEGAFEMGPITAWSTLLDHDDLGVAVLRFEIQSDSGVCELGFATDLGRPKPRLVEHLAGVDVLAIESNYCPELQAASNRPSFLKQRIMGGAGHLSNQQCADAVAEIAPREHVVFLHISRQCNEPARVATLHEAADYAWTIASQHEPTQWIWMTAAPRTAPRQTAQLKAEPARQPSLFETAP